MKKRWVERFLAMFLAALLVFVNDSVVSVALTVMDGETEITEPDGERWIQYADEDGFTPEDPKRSIDLFDGSKAQNEGGLSVEL